MYLCSFALLWAGWPFFFSPDRCSLTSCSFFCWVFVGLAFCAPRKIFVDCYTKAFVTDSAFQLLRHLPPVARRLQSEVRDDALGTSFNWRQYELKKSTAHNVNTIDRTPLPLSHLWLSAPAADDCFLERLKVSKIRRIFVCGNSLGRS